MTTATIRTEPSRVVELDGQLDADEWSWERRYGRMFDLALELERELNTATQVSDAWCRNEEKL